ncbi:MAG: Zn-ribbon domain-containing OB-fold protein [Aigarchaeota archaeon]|nr:Zn-ribbon domain-containing OB-fold protein [Aigarchaeota archaeon]MCX8192531.1 Zn-ribbon domain-containing OB-fold protein [Nitrososphaeria archaeon]MDW7985733.1 Zn-ribbon domain-containing OB-fold protein [Nitrososphaerota archaeon]
MFRIKVPRYWRHKDFRYRLNAWKCNHCGEVHFFKPLVCRRCRLREFNKVMLPETGKLIAYTIVRSPPCGFEEQTPYIIGFIELEDGTRILSQITDCYPEELKLGMKVEVTFRRVREDDPDKIIAYGYKFRPAI